MKNKSCAQTFLAFSAIDSDLPFWDIWYPVVPKIKDRRLFCWCYPTPSCIFRFTRPVARVTPSFCMHYAVSLEWDIINHVV